MSDHDQQQEQQDKKIKAEHKGSLQQPINDDDDDDESSSSSSSPSTAEHEKLQSNDNNNSNTKCEVVIPETKEHQVGVTEDGQPIMGRDRGGFEIDFSQNNNNNNNNNTANTAATATGNQPAKQEQKVQEGVEEEEEQEVFSLNDLPKNKYQKAVVTSPPQPQPQQKQNRYVAPHADPMAGIALEANSNTEKDQGEIQSRIGTMATFSSTDMISPPKLVETSKHHDNDNDDDEEEVKTEEKNKNEIKKPLDVTPQNDQNEKGDKKLDITPDDGNNNNDKKASNDHENIIRAFQEQNEKDNENEFGDDHDEWSAANVQFNAEHQIPPHQEESKKTAQDEKPVCKTPTSREEATPGPAQHEDVSISPQAPFSPQEGDDKKNNSNIQNNTNNNNNILHTKHQSSVSGLNDTIQRIDGVPTSPETQTIVASAEHGNSINTNQQQQVPPQHKRSLSGQTKSQVHFVLGQNPSTPTSSGGAPSATTGGAGGMHHAHSAGDFPSEITGHHHHTHSRSGSSFQNITSPTIGHNNNSVGAATNFGSVALVGSPSSHLNVPLQVRWQSIQKILLADAETIIGPSSSGSTSSSSSSSNGKNKSFCAVFCSCFLAPSNAERDLPTFMMMAKIPMAHNNHNHENLMKSIRVALHQLGGGGPADPLPSYDSMGFQSNDPANDLRGTGMLGLLQWYCLIKKHPDVASALWSDARNETHAFQFALASFEMTALVLQIMRTGELNSLVDEKEKAILKNLKEAAVSSSNTAAAHEKSEDVVNSNNHSNNNNKFTSPPERAEVLLDFAHDLYSGLMRHFSNLWRSAPRRSIMDFPPIRTMFKQLLSQDPVAMLFSSKPLSVGTTTHSGPSPAPRMANPPPARRVSNNNNNNNSDNPLPTSPTRVLNLNQPPPPAVVIDRDPVMTLPPVTSSAASNSNKSSKNAGRNSSRNAYASSNGEADGGNFSVMTTLANNAKDAEGFSSI